MLRSAWNVDTSQFSQCLIFVRFWSSYSGTSQLFQHHFIFPMSCLFIPTKIKDAKVNFFNGKAEIHKRSLNWWALYSIPILKRNQVTLWIVNDVTGKGTFNQERSLKFLVTYSFSRWNAHTETVKTSQGLSLWHYWRSIVTIPIF